MTDIDLSICIVSWNSRDELVDALESIARHSGGLRVQTIVVDNASADGSADLVERRFPEVTLIRSGSNLGFGRANNLAFRIAAGRYVLVLNPDMVVTERSLARMIDFMERHPRAGAAGCRLVNPDGRVQRSWFERFPGLLSELCWGFYLHRLAGIRALSGRRPGRDDEQSDRPVSYVAGACILMKREVVQRLGGFDRRYLIYGEDVDLCYRLHRMDLQVYYLGSVVMMHRHGASSGRQKRTYFTAVMQKESRYRFLLAHRGAAAAVLYRLIWLSAGTARTAAGLLATAALAPVGGGHGGTALKRYLARSAHTVSWSLGLERWTLR